jgi:hypothetical protein
VWTVLVKACQNSLTTTKPFFGKTRRHNSSKRLQWVFHACTHTARSKTFGHYNVEFVDNEFKLLNILVLVEFKLSIDYVELVDNKLNYQI